jgi:DNA-binding transcriptional regulator YiaG
MAAKWTPAAVKRLRKRLGLTQEAFARRLGVSVVTVNRWEQGHVEPRGLSVDALILQRKGT